MTKEHLINLLKYYSPQKIADKYKTTHKKISAFIKEYGINVKELQYERHKYEGITPSFEEILKEEIILKPRVKLNSCDIKGMVKSADGMVLKWFYERVG